MVRTATLTVSGAVWPVTRLNVTAGEAVPSVPETADAVSAPPVNSTVRAAGSAKTGATISNVIRAPLAGTKPLTAVSDRESTVATRALDVVASAATISVSGGTARVSAGPTTASVIGLLVRDVSDACTRPFCPATLPVTRPSTLSTQSVVSAARQRISAATLSPFRSRARAVRVMVSPTSTTAGSGRTTWSEITPPLSLLRLLQPATAAASTGSHA